MRKKYWIILLILLILIIGIMMPYILKFNTEKFSVEDLKWFKPFTKTDTAVFISEKNEIDSIIFFHIDTNKFSVRHLERGFYDGLELLVYNKITKGSYHKYLLLDSVENKSIMFRICNTSDSRHTEREFYFLGILFSDNDIDKITKIDELSYLFDAKKATYSEVNISEGIKNFTFKLDKGVVEFLDKRNVKWKRKKGNS